MRKKSIWILTMKKRTKTTNDRKGHSEMGAPLVFERRCDEQKKVATDIHKDKEYHR